MNRRSFMTAILASACAPMIVRASSLMRPRMMITQGWWMAEDSPFENMFAPEEWEPYVLNDDVLLEGFREVVDPDVPQLMAMRVGSGLLVPKAINRVALRLKQEVLRDTMFLLDESAAPSSVARPRSPPVIPS